eukprot:jgi/Ulvmu1/8180/UM040_0077.1
MSNSSSQRARGRASAPALVMSALCIWQPTNAAVFIRQFIEGSSFNKAISIINSGLGAVDISGWRLEEHVNVPSDRVLDRYTWAQMSVLQPGELATLCNEQASAFLKNRCNDTADLGINGNDAILLYSSTGDVVDQFGDTSGATLSGSTWTISCIDGASKDSTMLRAANSTAPIASDTAWAQRGLDAWTVYPQNTFVDTAGATFDVVSGTADPQRQPITICGEAPATAGTTPGPTPPPPPRFDPAPIGDIGPVPLLGTGDAVSDEGRSVDGASNSGSCAAPRSTPSVRGDRRTDLQTLRLATYNLEFLFDGVEDSRVSRWLGDPAGAQEHVERIAQFIATWAPDVVALVEVEGCRSLAALAAALRALPRGAGGAARDPASDADTLSGLLLQGTDSFTEQDIALLSTVDPSSELTRVDERMDYPLQGSGCGFDGQRNTGVSKHAVARWDGLRLGGATVNLAVIGVHFKAIPTDPRSCAQREAQAALMRREVQALSAAGYEVALVGDVNDFSADPPDAAGSQPTSRVLEILAGTAAGFEGGPVLRNVMEFVPQPDRITSWFDRNDDGDDDGLPGRENSAIDHALLSPGLWGRVADVLFIRDAPLAADGGALSDHWPIVITLAATAADGVCEGACLATARAAVASGASGACLGAGITAGAAAVGFCAAA